jgi:hypothetical protein
MWTLLCRKVLWKGRFAAQASKGAVLAAWKGRFAAQPLKRTPKAYVSHHTWQKRTRR